MLMRLLRPADHLVEHFFTKVSALTFVAGFLFELFKAVGHLFYTHDFSSSAGISSQFIWKHQRTMFNSTSFVTALIVSMERIF